MKEENYVLLKEKAIYMKDYPVWRTTLPPDSLDKKYTYIIIIKLEPTKDNEDFLNKLSDFEDEKIITGEVGLYGAGKLIEEFNLIDYKTKTIPSSPKDENIVSLYYRFSTDEEFEDSVIKVAIFTRSIFLEKFDVTIACDKY